MRALGQRETAAWVGRFGYLEVIDASDLLEDAVRGAVPDIHAEGKVAS